MLALCCARLNDRWQQQHTWNQHHREEIRWERFQKRRALRASKQAALRAEFQAPAVSIVEEVLSTKKPGRTPAQYAWGRQTFSPRMLLQGGYAKK